LILTKLNTGLPNNESKGRTMKKIFISYSHKDEVWKNRFKPHVEILENAGLDIMVWDDHDIDSGENWYPKITEAIGQSVVAICLISADFLASDFCIKEEVPFLLKKREQAGMLIIPILIRPCLWKAFPWLKTMQMLPRNGQSVAKHFKNDYDEVFSEVAEIIYKKLKRPTFAPETHLSKWKAPEKCDLTRMPMTGAELFGRQKEIEQLHSAWESRQIRVISFVAWGGVGKSTLIKKWLESMESDNFKGAQMVYAWSFYSQGTNERVTSADPFIYEALKWFGDKDPKQGSPWDKGKRLATLVRQKPTLLILDGLEPMQSCYDFEKGQIKDPSLSVMIKGLMRSSNYNTSQSLCVITTRVELPVAERYQKSFQQFDLEVISKEAGRAMLRVQGIRGSDKELEKASETFGNHALALNLLGAYLRDTHGHHIEHINQIPEINLSLEKGRHARKVMNAFALRWGESSETNLLHILGLFDRPAGQLSIESIICQDIILGLNDHLQSQSEANWLLMLEKLRKSRLVAPKSEHHPDTLDCHPLVREHFGENLYQINYKAWQQGHERLYKYYKELPKNKLPETLEEMTFLFSAVAHGCMAGKHREVYYDIFWDRICRKGDYVNKQLGTYSTYLAAVSNFFEKPWEKPSTRLTDIVKAVILSWAGYSLRALGRLKEASVPMKAGLDAVIKKEDWKNASSGAGSLSELFLSLGKVKVAVDYARKSVIFADKSGDWGEQMANRTTLADALHQSGELFEAEKLFREAENIQKEMQPEYQFLSSLGGFRFCDLLLNQGKYWEVIERAKHGIAIAKEEHWFLDIALDTLSLGRAYLFQALKQKSRNYNSSERFLNSAMEGLRKSGYQEYIASGLLSRTSLFRLQKNFTQAWEDLDESLEIAEQGDMKLYMADYHIEACQLLLAEIDYRGSGCSDLKELYHEHFWEAKELVKKTGYGRKNNILRGMYF